MTGSKTKVQAPHCPKCKSDGPFTVECAEWNAYTWDGEEWETDREYDVSPVAGFPYKVVCLTCEHEFEAEPWE